MATRSRSSADLQSPSERVIHVVSTHADTDPLELPRLYNAIDPDALDALIDTLESGAVEFEYAGNVVSVHSDGTVHVTGGAERGRDDARPAHG